MKTVLLSLFFVSLSARAVTCDLASHSAQVNLILHAIERNAELDKKHEENRRFYDHMSLDEILADQILLVDALTALRYISNADAVDLTKMLGYHERALSTGFMINQWGERARFFKEYVNPDLLEKLHAYSKIIVERNIAWEARAAKFRELLKDPRALNEGRFSTYVLDPLLGLNSAKLARTEATQFPSERFDSTHQQLLGTAYEPEYVWSNYAWMQILFAHSQIEAGDLVVDIGAGVGRAALFIAAMYPHARFEGLEFMPTRVADANAIIHRFNLQDRIHFRVADLRTAEVPVARHYYFFNALSEEPYRKVFGTLKVYARSHDFRIYVPFDEIDLLPGSDWLKLEFSDWIEQIKFRRDEATNAIDYYTAYDELRVFRSRKLGEKQP